LHGKRSLKGNEEVPTVVTQELLAPLAEAVSDELMASPAQARLSSLAGAIPLLFSVVIKRTELNKPKQRIAEGPWLQAVFVQLAKCAIPNFPVSQFTSQDDRCLDVLEDMLRLAVECKLVLDVSILQSIALFLSGIDKVGPSPRVKWTLINLCIEIDPNLAIALPARNNLSESTAVLNAGVLESILVNLTSLGFRDAGYGSKDYEIMLHGVILPLLHGFLRARNLPGFVHVWKQQIVFWENTKASYVASHVFSKDVTSIWEDETLLQAVSENVELSLTEGQILRILQQFPTEKISPGDVEPLNVAEVISEMIILDCFANGIKMESTTPAIKKQLKLLLGSLSAAKENASSEAYSWRVWRILATEARYWLPTDLGSSTSTALSERCVRAQEHLICNIAHGTQGLHTSATYARALFAFRFLIASFRAFWHTETDVTLPIIPAVQAIVHSMKILVDSIREDVGDVIDCSEPFVAWDGQRCSLKTRHSLTLACAAQLALSPGTLRYVRVEEGEVWSLTLCSRFQPDLLNSFLDELFRCASLQAFPRSIEVSEITYRHVWEEMLNPGALQEYTPLAGMHAVPTALNHGSNRWLDSVWSTLVENFINLEGESKVGTRNAREELALSGLYNVPFNALRAHERNRIFQNASSRLLSSGLTVSCTKYLTLLNHCIPYIKKSTDLVCQQLDPHCSHLTATSSPTLLTFGTSQGH